MLTLTIQFNGKPLEIAEGTSITQLLQLVDMRTELVAVERNMELVPRKRHAETILCEGDAVEAVTLVGGG